MLALKIRGYNDGHLERKTGGKYEGEITIDNVNLSPIEGVYFSEGNKKYLWIKRKPILDWDFERQEYIKRSREPRFEAYLEKQIGSDSIAYKGECTFLRFKYEITGIWDRVEKESKHRINFFVERLPMNKQTIINGINERNRENARTK